MPTVLRDDGFTVRVHGPPREHPPPPAHVERGAEQVVVIRRGTSEAPPAVWKVFGMSSRDVLRAYRLVERHHVAIEAAWRKIHG